MALSDYALIDANDLRTYQGSEGTGENDRFEDAINSASAFIEQETNRHFITRGAVTEYHTVGDTCHSIRLAHSPTITVTSVHESITSPRAYDATTLLTANTDYISVSTAEIALIRRLSNSELYYWATGYRAIKVVYSYGYADRDSLPEDLRHLAMQLSASIFKEADRGWHGLTNITDATGTMTRIGRLVTPDMKRTLGAYTAEFFERTWEAA